MKTGTLKEWRDMSAEEKNALQMAEHKGEVRRWDTPKLAQILHPKIWHFMTDEEKGALLLAHHEGKVIEAWQWGHDKWLEIDCPQWGDDDAYRVRPEPKRETVEIYSGGVRYKAWCSTEDFDDTHRITFDLVDGKPDCTKCPTCGTAKHVDMEEL